MAGTEEPGGPRVVAEDPSFVAVSKPPRMHCAPGLGAGDLCSWVRERYPETAGAAAPGRFPAGSRRRPEEGYLLHRLDFETSGLVLFARDAEARERLLEEQAQGAFRKEYLALCSASRRPSPLGSSPALGPVPGVDEEAWASAREAEDGEAMLALLGEGPLPIISAFRPYGPRGARVACSLEPRAAGSAYVTEILGPAALPSAAAPGGLLGLRLRLARGFRHQVRAHLAWIGLPISGDPLYGGAGDERLRLYATVLEFAHPGTGAAVRIALEP